MERLHATATILKIDDAIILNVIAWQTEINVNMLFQFNANDCCSWK